MMSVFRLCLVFFDHGSWYSVQLNKVFKFSRCFSSSAFDRDCKLYLNGTVIKQVSSVKFLGVTIDENLTWRPHLDNLKKKLACSLGALFRIKDSVPKALHKTLYHSLFESHLNYGISVWGSQSHTVLQELFTLQKKCIRTEFNTIQITKLIY